MFQAHFSRFLQGQRTDFRFGDWLMSMTDSQIDEFNRQLELFAENTSETRQHCPTLAELLLSAALVERRCRGRAPATHRGQEYFHRLLAMAQVCVMLERLRRKGLLYVEGRLSLTVGISVHPTQAGTQLLAAGAA